MKFVNDHDKEFIKWAKKATAGIDTSDSMIGFIDGSKNSVNYWKFAVQIGHLLMEGKPLMLVIPIGHKAPDKLLAAATVVEYFTPGNEAAMKEAIKRGMSKLGKPVVQ